MRHPADLDALVYIGRKSGAPCLAMLGDSDNQRPYQSLLQTQCLGVLSGWEELWTTLDPFRCEAFIYARIAQENAGLGNSSRLSNRSLRFPQRYKI
jgi:hypothetical protein